MKVFQGIMFINFDPLDQKKQYYVSSLTDEKFSPGRVQKLFCTFNVYTT